MEIDVWASLSYSHLHWWLHARSRIHATGNRAIHNKWWTDAHFLTDDDNTSSRITVSSPCSSVSCRCFPPRWWATLAPRAKFRQTDPLLAHADSHASVFPFYILLRYLSRTQSIHYGERKLCFLTTLEFRTIRRCFRFLQRLHLRCWERVILVKITPQLEIDS